VIRAEDSTYEWIRFEFARDDNSAMLDPSRMDDFDEWVREIRQAAWEEGFAACHFENMALSANPSHQLRRINPYLPEEDDE
jgi:DNA-binding SARP family transcriptional activator